MKSPTKLDVVTHILTLRRSDFRLARNGSGIRCAYRDLDGVMRPSTSLGQASRYLEGTNGLDDPASREAFLAEAQIRHEPLFDMWVRKLTSMNVWRRDLRALTGLYTPKLRPFEDLGCREGWIATEAGIAALDEDTVFATDEDAERYVVLKAAAGSSRHLAVMEHVRAENPTEWQRIMDRERVERWGLIYRKKG